MTEPHPLFPIEAADDDEPIEVGWIHVTRFEGGGQKWAPRLFAGTELDSLETLAELFGGGTYELIARTHDRRSITGRRRYALPGAMRPLTGEEPGAFQAPPLAAPATSTNDALLIALMQMMSQQQAATTQLMVAMLTRADTSSKEHIQSMTSLHEGFAKGQAELFRAMLEAKGGGGGASDTFIKGIEFAQELQEGIREGAAADDGGSGDLKELLEGAKMFMAMSAQDRQLELEKMKLQAQERAQAAAPRRPPPPPPKQQPPPNGSAAP